MPMLIAKNGPEKGKRIPLEREHASVGRQPGSFLEFKADQKISRFHAELVTAGGSYEIRDLDSRNGTFVNDERLVENQALMLRDGDIIRFVDVEYAYYVSDPDKRDKTTTSKNKTSKSTVTLEPVSPEMEASSVEAIVVDDDTADDSSSTILAKFNVTSGPAGGVQLTASLQARLEALLEIARSLGKALSLDEVLPQVLNSLFKIFLQADRGFIVLKTEDGTLVPRWTKARRASQEETVRISRTIVRTVMDAKEAILSNNLASDERLDMSNSIAELRIRSMMCAPLLDSEGNAMGVLQIDTRGHGKGFREDDLEVLASVGIQAGIAIDNAQLHERTLHQQEVEQDLLLANEVQLAFLPQGPPQLEGYDFFDYYKPANHVGGDYYDYVTLPDGRTAVIVADVVGHGVAAAMMMAKVSAEAKFCLASEPLPCNAITRLNDRLSQMHIDRFVTLIMVVLDPGKHEATIVNAGHMAPIWLRGTSGLEEPGADVSGLPVGIVGGMDYQQKTITLGPGEMLVMYTDGINESMNPLGKQYTIDRIRECLRTNEKDPKVVGQAIIDDVTLHAGSAVQADDMCMVILSRK